KEAEDESREQTGVKARFRRQAGERRVGETCRQQVGGQRQSGDHVRTKPVGAVVPHPRRQRDGGHVGTLSLTAATPNAEPARPSAPVPDVQSTVRTPKPKPEAETRTPHSRKPAGWAPQTPRHRSRVAELQPAVSADTVAGKTGVSFGKQDGTGCAERLPAPCLSAVSSVLRSSSSSRPGAP